MARDDMMSALGAPDDLGVEPDADLDDDLGEDMKEAKMTAAGDMISAMKAEDPQSLIDAYKRLRDACEADYSE